MKKIILTVAVCLASLAATAQDGFYVSLGGGPSFSANEKLLSTSEGALRGTYGEGNQVQVRAGYFFNDKFGAELGLGYLHGSEQKIREDYLNVTGKARAYGAALAGIYNISPNVYVKAGLLTKIGGKSVNEGSLDTKVPLINPANGQVLGLAPLHVEFERDGKGNLPIGYLGAFGFKYRFDNSNWGLFAEMEYQGIDITPDSSSLTNYAATLTTPQGVLNPTRDELVTLASQLIGAGALNIKAEDLLSIADEFTYASQADIPNKVRKEFDVPYSSFGFVFGLTYYFD